MRTITLADLTRLGQFAVEKRVVVGVPNNGRLLAEVTEMIGPLVGLAPHHRGLLFESDDMVVLCARSCDLPFLAAHGIADLVLTGYDYVIEAGVELEEIYDTGFQSCVVGVVGAVRHADWRHASMVRVATQYPGIARQFFSQPGMPDSELLTVTGAAEFYARTGIADVIVDAYMTGDTAKANDLVMLEPIMTTSGRLFARPGWREDSKDISAVSEMLVR